MLGGLVLLILLVLIFLPRPAEAGLLSALARFFGVYSNEIEEYLPPVLVPQSQAAVEVSAVEADNRPPTDETGDAGNPLGVVQGNAIVAPLNPLGAMPAADSHAAGQIFIYTLRKGDTLSDIAKAFDVTVNTILWANGLADARSIKVGDQLLILPITGVRHEVKKGETVAAIARKYRAAAEDIVQFNGLAVGEEPTAGALLIVPNGELPQSAPLTPSVPRPSYFANLPLYEGYYIRPITGGRRSRGLHGFNGVDLANTCGLPVVAAADGTVLVARSSGWNGGYGKYVVIAHPNNTQTLYSHLKELKVSVGAGLRQGEAIGAIGSTGNSTGCHVHFEIRGARNPF